MAKQEIQSVRNYWDGMANVKERPTIETMRLNDHYWAGLTGEPGDVDYIEAVIGNIPALWAVPKDVTRMQTAQPNFSKQDIANIHVPMMIVQSERDEFIKGEHARYLAQSIPGASFALLKDVSHFAPLQRPSQFSEVILTFLLKISQKTTAPVLQ
jgi:pimeloyl-ACP methyl ester carboxylesterase